MSAYRLDPLRGLDSLVKKVSMLASDFDKGFNIEYGSFAPKVDISEDKDKVYIHAELPGIKKDDVKVTISDENVLMIKGEKKNTNRTESNENNKTLIRVERHYGEFSRSFLLPETVMKDSIKAKFEDGVLDVTLEKKEPEKPNEVEVEIL